MRAGRVSVTIGFITCISACQAAAADPPVDLDLSIVEVSAARLMPGGEALVLHGVARATDRAVLGFAVGGRLLERRVDIGDVVSEGDILARIDAQPFRNAEDAARAQLAGLDVQQRQLERDADRARRLRVEGALADSAEERALSGRDAILASRDAALAQLTESRRQRGETFLRAPHDGVVRAVLADEGAVLAPGAPVLALANTDAVEIVAEAPERALTWLAPGATAEVELPATGVSSPARVVALARAAGPSGLFPLRLAMSSRDVAPGQGAVIRVQRAEHEELRVPLRAIVDPSGEAPFVWRLDADRRVRRVAISIAALREGAEVALHPGSLEPTALVVVGGHRLLLEGDRVQPRAEGSSRARETP